MKHKQITVQVYTQQYPILSEHPLRRSGLCECLRVDSQLLGARLGTSIHLLDNEPPTEAGQGWKGALTSLTTVAACLRTSSSGNLRQVRILGKTSASTTTSAMSTLCLAIWANAQHTCLFSLGSCFKTKGARYATAPAPTLAACTNRTVQPQSCCRLLGLLLCDHRSQEVR